MQMNIEVDEKTLPSGTTEATGATGATRNLNYAFS